MALYFPETDALWLSIPKTGCSWIRTVVQAAELPVVSLDDDTHPGLNMHCLAWHMPYREASYVFAFVRHPLTWYESWWKYQAGVWDDCVRPAWHPLRQHVEHCQSDDFNEFIRLCIEHEPGYLTRMYEWFLGPRDAGMSQFVGRYERLHEDLADVLEKLGYPVGEDWLRQQPPVNVSAARRGQPQWDPALREVILHLERPTLARFYPEDPSL